MPAPRANRARAPFAHPGFPSTAFATAVARRLLDDRGDDAGADGAAAFADGEAQLFFHRDRHDQFDGNRDVVARHDHLGAFRQRDDAGHVRRAEVELRTVVGEERRMTAAFFLRQDVGFSHELLVRLDRTRLAQDLAALDAVTGDAADQRADVVAGLALVEQLAEHFNAGNRRLGGGADADDLDFLANLDDAALDATGHDRATARDREHVFDRQQERQVDRTLRRRDVGVDSSHQLADRVFADLLVRIFESGQSRTLDDRDVVAREVVHRQQFAHFQLDELEKLGVVDLVDLVEEHDDRGNADLTGEQDVLAGLRHRAVGGRANQDRAVHLRGTGDHVLDVVGVAGAVDVGIVTGRPSRIRRVPSRW